MDYKVVKECRICKSSNLQKYLDLGEVPLANSLLESQSQFSKKYPIEMLLCLDCHLSQLSIVVEPEVMFSNYPYHSSVSQTFKEHCYHMALKLKEFETNEYPLVVDIASNDGCLLKVFQEVGYTRLLGFDPANNLASSPYGDIDGDSLPIPVVNDFFSEKTAKQIRGDSAGQGASFVIAQNVLAHVDNLHDFLKGVHWFLDDKGVFVAEFPYLANLIENNQFDTIYHEHLSYFLLKPLISLFKDNGLTIFRVEQYPIHGGSIRVYASKGLYDEGESVKEMLDFEESKELYSIETYTKFADRALRVMNDFKMCLENIHESGKKVMAYGASAKGISLMNYSGIKREWIHAIVDDTPDKQGKFTPGTLIPIIDSNGFKDECAYFIVLLAWNFAQELMNKCWWHNGYYIIPIPEVKIV